MQDLAKISGIVFLEHAIARLGYWGPIPLARDDDDAVQLLRDCQYLLLTEAEYQE